MEPVWNYDATIRAFTDPTAARTFFADPGPYPEAVLCAELAQLVFSNDRDFVAATLARAGFSTHDWYHVSGSDAILIQGADVAVLAFRGTDPPSLRRLAEGTPFRALFAGEQSWRDRFRNVFQGGRPDLPGLLERFGVEMRDIVTDLNALPTEWPAGGQVHRGFARALTGIWETIAPAVERVDVPILYTGCSLGAALAILAASLHPPHAVHAFGAPLMGDKVFAATLADIDVYRYINCCDIACRLPPGLYDPVGTLRYIDRYGRIGMVEEPESGRHAARLAHLRRYIGQWDKIWVRDISDHAPENYRRAVLRDSLCQQNSTL